MALPTDNALLLQAGEHERNCEWGEAARCYKELAKESGGNGSWWGLKVVTCYQWFAHQSETPKEYRERIDKGIEECDEIEQKLTNGEKDPARKIAAAQRLKLQSFLEPDYEKRRPLLSDSISSLRAVLDKEKVGSPYWLEAALALLFAWQERESVEFDFGQEFRASTEWLLEFGRALVKLPEIQNNPDILAQACALQLGVEYTGYLEGKIFSEEIYRLGEEVVTRATSKSTLALLYRSLTWGSEFVSGAHKRGAEYAAKARALSEATRDRLGEGRGLLGRNYDRRWTLIAEQDRDRATVIFDEILRDFERGKNMLAPFAEATLQARLSDAYADVCQSHVVYALNFVTNPREKKSILERGVQIFREARGWVKSVESKAFLQFAGALALEKLAEMEDDEVKRKAILNEAVQVTEEDLALDQKVWSHYDWNLGINTCLDASVRHVLAREVSSREEKLSLLTTAKERFKLGLELMFRDIKRWSTPARVIRLADFRQRFASTLGDMYGLTQDQGALEDQLGVLDEIVKDYVGAQRKAWAAQTLWEKASVLGRLSRHKEASASYELASLTYAESASENAAARELYAEVAGYMSGWASIENALSAHELEDYEGASGQYLKSAESMGRVKMGSFLVSNFMALSSLEDGEHISRAGKDKEAILAFNRAADLFKKAEPEISQSVSTSSTKEEREHVQGLLEAMPLRKDYCNARTLLEEARVADRSGKEAEAVEKYSESSSLFSALAKRSQSDPAGKDFEQIAGLARAWQKMSEAERKVSPDLFGEAAAIFQEVNEKATKEKIGLLALANSRVCLALQAIAEFQLEHTTDLYTKAKQEMDSAANFYSRAGYEKEANWARATQRLFDAYIYIDSAQKETGPEKKARFYAMSEKVLRMAADIYASAGFEGKRVEAEKALEAVRGEKEVALTLAQIMEAPTILTSTSGFSMPEPTREAPVGLERFEKAEIQSRLYVPQKEVYIGEDLPLELEMVNVGKAVALVMKVDDLVPNGFEVSSKPENLRVVGSGLDLRGRKLDPLRTEEIKIWLKATKKGAYALKPRILYVDDRGTYREHELEEVILTVKEMGIGGWLKGTRG